MQLTDPKPTFIDLAGGEQIFRHDITKDMLRHSNLLHILSSAGENKKSVIVPNGMETKLSSIHRVLQNIEKQAPFIIHVAPGFEATDEFKKNFKGYS